MAQVMRGHGPFWAYTCYNLESYNHTILKSINGTYQCEQAAIRANSTTQHVSERKIFIIDEAVLKILDIMKNRYHQTKLERIKISQHLYPRGIKAW